METSSPSYMRGSARTGATALPSAHQGSVAKVAVSQNGGSFVDSTIGW